MEEVKEEKVSFFKKHKDLIMEILRFLLVGGSATLIDWVISFVICAVTPSVMLGTLDVTHTLLATSAGFMVGLVYNYFLSVIFVYKNKKDENEGKSFKDFMVFFLISIGVLAFQLLFSFLVNDLLFVQALNWDVKFIGSLSWGYIITRVFSTAIGLVVNYILRKIFIFK